MIPLWIDCDPGQDDVIALTLVAYHASFEIVGISTVHGNSSLKNTTRNTLRFLSALGKTDVPVYPGSPESLQGTTGGAPEVHGKTGLSGSKLLPEPQFSAKEPQDFFPAFKAAVEKYEGQICIAAIAPLTNIAKVFKEYPELKSKFRYLVIMGGGFQIFNKEGVAEFNIYDDALAAKLVLTDPELADRLYLAPLDTTSNVRASVSTMDEIRGAPSVEKASNFRALMYEMIYSFYLNVKKRKGPEYVGPSMHDPVALGALLQLCDGQQVGYTFEKRAVDVIVATGATIDAADSRPKISIVTGVDTAAFLAVLLACYTEADRHAWVNTVDRAWLIDHYQP